VFFPAACLVWRGDLMTQTPDKGGPMRGVKSRLGQVLWVLAIVGAVVLVRLLDVHVFLRAGLERIQDLGLWGAVLFALLYAMAAVLLLPGVILTLGAGAVFGLIKGSVLVSVSATLGATAAFFVGRYLARSWVVKQIEAFPRFKAIDDAVAREGWKIVGLTRLSPAFPFNLLNYAFGVTRVSPRDYILASWIGMMPGTVMYVYIGSLAGDLTTLGGGPQGRSPAEWALSIVGLLATVTVTVYVTRLARTALRQRVAE
jgi:uncharacterized membrane protein YdjX (TVP38/TMEM64 family)